MSNSKTDQYVGAMSLAAVAIFVSGLLLGQWHVERGPAGKNAARADPAAASVAPASSAALGEPMPDGRLRLGTGILTPHSAEGADLYIESSIPPTTAERIVAAVNADVRQVQRTYGRRFAVRPQTYVFSGRSAYNRGVELILGKEVTLATTESAGVALSARSVVAVDWSFVSVENPLTSFRHELTHLMIAQIAKPRAEKPVPTWLNEGSARLEEFTVSGTDWRHIQHRTAAASMFAARNYFAPQALRGAEDWGSRIGSIASLAYIEAAAAVEVLRADIGAAGVIRILELMGQGQKFDDAFLEVAGIPAASFEDSAPGRFRYLTDQVPGVIARMDEGVLRIRAYGFKPKSEINFDAVGRSTRSRNTDHKRVTVDESGIWETSLGAAWPADVYVITVTGASSASAPPGEPVTVTVTATRTVKD